MIEPLKKIIVDEEYRLSAHPMMSHLKGTRQVEHWDYLLLPEKLNEIIEAVNMLTGLSSTLVAAVNTLEKNPLQSHA